MTREEIEKLYNDLSDHKIEDLYIYSCLLCSGFNKEMAYYFIPRLKELWLKDENESCISKLSDLLFDLYEENGRDILELTTREMLEVMF